jgi:hypothetical protein
MHQICEKGKLGNNKSCQAFQNHVETASYPVEKVQYTLYRYYKNNRRPHLALLLCRIRTIFPRVAALITDYQQVAINISS